MRTFQGTVRAQVADLVEPMNVADASLQGNTLAGVMIHNVDEVLYHLNRAKETVGAWEAWDASGARPHAEVFGFVFELATYRYTLLRSWLERKGEPDDRDKKVLDVAVAKTYTCLRDAFETWQAVNRPDSDRASVVAAAERLGRDPEIRAALAKRSEAYGVLHRIS